MPAAPPAAPPAGAPPAPLTGPTVIDQLLALDPGRRGIARFFVKGGAEAAARTLARARRVVITTGFALGPGLPETDGPPGAAVIGRALALLGIDVAYVTDAVTVPPLAAALRVLGDSTPIITWEARDDADAAARRLLRDERPSHLLSIERPGRAVDGDYRSARAESIMAWNAPLDALFLHAPRSVVTIGIGDGGNEIGMGNVRARVIRSGHLGRSIASVVKVRHLVVAGTSNWGGWGVVAELSRRTGRMLLHTPDDAAADGPACVDAGAVDGITRRAEPTVDGLPLDVHAVNLSRRSGSRAPRRLLVPGPAAPPTIRSQGRQDPMTTQPGSSVIDTYRALHPKSAALYERARASSPAPSPTTAAAVARSPSTSIAPTGPTSGTSTATSYIDFWIGHGALLLGHGHPAGGRGHAEQVGNGIHLGACHELEVRWAEQISRLVPSAEMVRFTMSGTEATQLAMRVARAHTGRTKVLKFYGHFHGWHDGVVGGVNAPFDVAVLRGSAGVTLDQLVAVRPQRHQGGGWPPRARRRGRGHP